MPTTRFRHEEATHGQAEGVVELDDGEGAGARRQALTLLPQAIRRPQT
jgi:hypothetical protein